MDPAALAVEQRLAPLIGGNLAKLLVEELGPEAAEGVLPARARRWSDGWARTLGAILLISRNLAPEVVERLLAGGLRPKAIASAVADGQAGRLATLTRGPDRAPRGGCPKTASIVSSACPKRNFNGSSICRSRSFAPLRT